MQDVPTTLQAEFHQTDNSSCCAVVCDAAGVVDWAECDGSVERKFWQLLIPGQSALLH